MLTYKEIVEQFDNKIVQIPSGRKWKFGKIHFTDSKAWIDGTRRAYSPWCEIISEEAAKHRTAHSLHADGSYRKSRGVVKVCYAGDIPYLVQSGYLVLK
jgi:hypothetical protein